MRTIRNAATAGNDEMYTPPALAQSILPFVRQFCVAEDICKPLVWCPFDTDSSEIVKALRSIGCEVSATIV